MNFYYSIQEYYDAIDKSNKIEPKPLSKGTQPLFIDLDYQIVREELSIYENIKI